LLWLLNLFNFMDGIDGIAAGEAVFVSLSVAAAALASGSGDRSVWLAFIVAGAALGFLRWNWPPARIFMGDVGSGFLGFMLGSLSIIAHQKWRVPVSVPLILLGVFVADATTTLLCRIFRGEKWYASHRSHAYQRLSQRFGAHGPVTFLVMLVNVA